MLKDDTHCGREPYVDDTDIHPLAHDVIKYMDYMRDDTVSDRR
jgi:hypothetical protein